MQLAMHVLLNVKDSAEGLGRGIYYWSFDLLVRLLGEGIEHRERPDCGTPRRHSPFQNAAIVRITSASQ